MKRFLAAAALLTATALFAAPTAASAADCHRTHQQSTGNVGLLNGTQVYLPVDLDLDVTGNALALLGGTASASDSSTTTVDCGN